MKDPFVVHQAYGCGLDGAGNVLINPKTVSIKSDNTIFGEEAQAIKEPQQMAMRQNWYLHLEACSARSDLYMNRSSSHDDLEARIAGSVFGLVEEIGPAPRTFYKKSRGRSEFSSPRENDGGCSHVSFYAKQLSKQLPNVPKIKPASVVGFLSNPRSPQPQNESSPSLDRRLPPSSGLGPWLSRAPHAALLGVGGREEAGGGRGAGRRRCSVGGLVCGARPPPGLEGFWAGNAGTAAVSVAASVRRGSRARERARPGERGSDSGINKQGGPRRSPSTVQGRRGLAMDETAHKKGQEMNVRARPPGPRQPCRAGGEQPPYLHQDGRVVKALDLRSNGHMSAWVRTPLLVQRFFLSHK
ncbi:uncharacterized protein [Notamacropus eugenii]|uniref:uncharacterized protein n=1 Tax=Notamacropus eugenii TaxID=9315 RepID=UPI003B67A9B5